MSPSQALVVINDIDESECGGLYSAYYNVCGLLDLYIDFLFTVPTLSLSSEIYVALETDGSVEVCAVLNLPLAIPLDFIVTATDTGSATAGIITYMIVLLVPPTLLGV